MTLNPSGIEVNFYNDWVIIIIVSGTSKGKEGGALQLRQVCWVEKESDILKA